MNEREFFFEWDICSLSSSKFQKGLQKGGIVISCINFQKFIEIGSIKRKVRAGERIGNKIRPEVRRI